MTTWSNQPHTDARSIGSPIGMLLTLTLSEADLRLTRWTNLAETNSAAVGSPLGLLLTLTHNDPTSGMVWTNQDKS